MQKTVLVTGASRGIGREIAVRFAKEGYNVAVNYCSHETEAIRTVNLLNTLGGPFRIDNVTAIQADVSDRVQVEAMFRQIHGTFGGGVDILVNNAGIAQQKVFSDITEEDWDRMFGVDVKGMFHCCQCALPHMIEKKAGKIINISSMWGQVGASCEVHYSTAKAALIGMTKALAKEAGPHGIRVNAVAPGFIVTDMTLENKPAFDSYRAASPIGMLGEPEYIAEAVSYVVGAEFMTGQIISPNGGLVI